MTHRCVAAISLRRRVVRYFLTTLSAFTFLIFGETIPAHAEHESDAPAAIPCPDEAPVKQFNIVAFRLAIAYNAWGDIEHTGAMFAFVAEKQAILDQVKANWTKPAWRVQPLVIRVNVGDCIKLRLKNDLQFDASLTVSRAQYNVLRDDGFWWAGMRRAAPFPRTGFIPSRQTLDIGWKQILAANGNAHAKNGLHQQAIGAC